MAKMTWTELFDIIKSVSPQIHLLRIYYSGGRSFVVLVWLVVAGYNWYKIFHFWTLDEKESYLRIGWISYPYSNSSIARAVRDYRLLAVLASSVAGIVVGAPTLWFTRTPRNVIGLVGSSDIWALSPYGASLVLHYLSIIFIIHILLLASVALSAYIVSTDPYNKGGENERN